MTQYQQAGQMSLEEERKKVAAYHAKIPHLTDVAHSFDPSGLVPYPCTHGIAVKPARFPVTKGGTAWLDAEGNERPPFGGQSWGRSKHLRITAFGGRNGVPFAIAECVKCVGEPEPTDFYTAADGSSLR